MVNPKSLTIRAKKLGALIRDARLASGKSIEQCAQIASVSDETFEAYEQGEKSPSLPELEFLSYSLEIPVEHFWEDTAITRQDGRETGPDLGRLIRLRQRLIGAQIRKARLEAGFSLEELAEKAWSSPTLLESYELGETAIPLPDLELISTALDRSIKDFLDRHGPVGQWAAQQRAIQGFLGLPPDLQAFAGKPINRPYLELAQRLSEMSVDKLRAVAEGLLEITL